MTFLLSYAAASGQEFNISKSNFYVHHSTLQTKRRIIQNVTGFSEAQFPLMYLGAPISYKKLHINDFNFL